MKVASSWHVVIAGANFHPPGWQGWTGTVFAIGFLLATGHHPLAETQASNVYTLGAATG